MLRSTDDLFKKDDQLVRISSSQGEIPQMADRVWGGCAQCTLRVKMVYEMSQTCITARTCCIFPPFSPVAGMLMSITIQSLQSSAAAKPWLGLSPHQSFPCQPNPKILFRFSCSCSHCCLDPSYRFQTRLPFFHSFVQLRASPGKCLPVEVFSYGFTDSFSIAEALLIIYPLFHS